MNRLSEEKSKFVLKLEVSIPDAAGGPSKKFAVNRSLKAKWSQNSDQTMRMIHEELSSYKGSFVGDMATVLLQLIKSKELEEANHPGKENDVLKWTSELLQYFIYASIKDKLHEELLSNPEIHEHDGATKEIDKIKPIDITSIDIDRLMILLAPHVKHALYLVSKEIKHDNSSGA